MLIFLKTFFIRLFNLGPTKEYRQLLEIMESEFPPKNPIMLTVMNLEKLTNPEREKILLQIVSDIFKKGKYIRNTSHNKILPALVRRSRFFSEQISTNLIIDGKFVAKGMAEVEFLIKPIFICRPEIFKTLCKSGTLLESEYSKYFTDEYKPSFWGV